MNESFRWVDVSVLRGDAGAARLRRVEFSEPSAEKVGEVRSDAWYRGPGEYTLQFDYLRRDGGAGSHVTPFAMNRDDVRARGFATFFGGGDGTDPQLHLELVEQAPADLRMELLSEISREGLARYAVVNHTQRTFFPDTATVVLERLEPSGWARLGRGMCLGSDRDSLKPRERMTLDVAAGSCLDGPLPPGRYRHSIDVDTARRGPACETYDDSSEVVRNVQLTHEFDVSSVQRRSAHALSDVRVGELSVGSEVSYGDDFSATLIAPDGGSACVCKGTVVGKERLRALRGLDGLCLTVNPDASTIACEPLAPSARLGDHPPYGKPWDDGAH